MTLLRTQAREDGASPPGRSAAAVGADRSGEIGFANAWIASVDAGRRRLPGWLVLLLALGAVAGAMYGGAALYGATPAVHGSYGATVLDRLLQAGCIVGPLLAFALLMIFGVERRGPLRASIPPLRASLFGGAAGVGGYLLAVALALTLGAVATGAGSPAGARWVGLATGALLILFQAGCEEAFFRAWLQPALAARWGAWVALVCTSVLFAAAHGLLRGLSPLAFVNDTLAAAVFGILAYRTGGLYAPVAAHWGWNWVEQSVLGLTPNPGVDPLGSLFDLDLKGPGLLTGGSDEMNGSICATAALLALVGCALWLGSGRRLARVRQS